MSTSMKTTTWVRELSHEITLADLIAKKTISPESAAFLSSVVKRRGRILFYGNASTGKATLVKALTSEIPPASSLKILSSKDFNLSRQGLTLTKDEPDADYFLIDDNSNELKNNLKPVFYIHRPQNSITNKKYTLLDVKDDLAKNDLGELFETFDVFVNLVKQKQNDGNKVTRFIASVISQDNGLLTELENSFLDPWNEIKHRLNETYTPRVENFILKLKNKTPDVNIILHQDSNGVITSCPLETFHASTLLYAKDAGVTHVRDSVLLQLLEADTDILMLDSRRLPNLQPLFSKDFEDKLKKFNFQKCSTLEKENSFAFNFVKNLDIEDFMQLFKGEKSLPENSPTFDVLLQEIFTLWERVLALKPTDVELDFFAYINAVTVNTGHVANIVKKSFASYLKDVVQTQEDFTRDFPTIFSDSHYLPEHSVALNAYFKTITQGGFKSIFDKKEKDFLNVKAAGFTYFGYSSKHKSASFELTHKAVKLQLEALIDERLDLVNSGVKLNHKIIATLDILASEVLSSIDSTRLREAKMSHLSITVPGENPYHRSNKNSIYVNLDKSNNLEIKILF